MRSTAGRPANKFVAGFIGAPAMTFIPFTLQDEAGTLVAVAPSVRLRLAPAHQQVLQAWRGQAVILGVRSEHLKLAAPSTENSLAVRVDVTEQLGSENVLETRLNELNLTVSRVDPATVLVCDELVHLAVDCGQPHFFDPATEVSLLAGVAA